MRHSDLATKAAARSHSLRKFVPGGDWNGVIFIMERRTTQLTCTGRTGELNLGKAYMRPVSGAAPGSADLNPHLELDASLKFHRHSRTVGGSGAGGLPADELCLKTE